MYPGGVGEFRDLPLLAHDGTGLEGAGEAAVNTCQDTGDTWATAAYRRGIAGVLVKRCIDNIQAISPIS